MKKSSRLIERIGHYLLSPKYHFSRIQFNLITLLFVIVGFTVGTYFTLKQIYNARAASDTVKTWTLNAANASQFTYDANLISVGDSGARPVINKFANGTFNSDLASWSEAQPYTLNDDFSTALPLALVSGVSTLTNAGVITPAVGAELVTNGSFTTDTNFTKEAPWTISGGTANFDGSVAGGSFYQNSILTIGRWYSGQIDITDAFGGSYGVIPQLALTTYYKNIGTYYFTGKTAYAFGGFYASSSGEPGKVDNFSLKQLTLSSLFSTVTETTVNKIVSVGVTLTANTQAGLVLNLDSASTPANFVIAYHDGVNVHLEKCVAGTYTSLINVAATYSAGATLKVIKSGSAYNLVYNNVLIAGSPVTISDSGIVNNTLQGLFSTYVSNTFSNFSILTNIDGTQASPLGGTRTVTDSNGKLSIGSGKLNFVTGGVAGGDPGLWYQSIARNVGTVIIGTVVPGSINANGWFGLDNAPSGNPRDGIRFSTVGNLTLTDNNTYTPLVGTYTAGIYKVAYVIRATGTYTFIKGGAYTNWTLLWVSKAGSVNPYYVSVVATSTSSAFTADDIRIPTANWVPTPLAYSSFSSNGATTTDATGPDSQPAPALTLNGGIVSGGTLSISPTTGSELLTNGNMETGNPPTGVVAYGGGVISSVSDERTGGSGSKSLSGIRGSYNFNSYKTVAVNTGTWYIANYWLRNVNAASVRVDVEMPASTNTATYSGTSWANRFHSFRSAGNTANFWFYSNTSGEGRFDDVSLMPLTLSSLFSTVSTSDSDAIVDAEVTLTAGTQAGLVVSLDSESNPANFVIAYHDGTNVKLDKVVNGVYSNLINVVTTYVPGATLRVVKEGTKYNVFYNSSNIGAEQVVSDAGIISNTKYGMFSTYGGNTFDNFSIWARGSTAIKFASAPFEELTATRDTTTKYEGASSVKLVAASVDANYLQSVTAGDSSIYNYSAYVYTNGSAVTASDVSLYYDTSTISTTYTSVGGGWYRIAGSVTGSVSAKDYGIRVKAEKIVYFDNVQLYRVGTNVLTINTAYTNNNVNTWDTLCEGTLSGDTCSVDVVHSGASAVKYQLSTDNGSTWQYYSGSAWTTASNITTHLNTAAELTVPVMHALSVTNKSLSVKIIFETDGNDIPLLPHLSLGITTDNLPPSNNASAIVMKRFTTGTEVALSDWTNNIAPYFTWTAGSDNVGGVGLKGYCLYLGIDPAGNPETTKGAYLGISPVSTANTTCQFIVSSNAIDFATVALRASPWLTTSDDVYYLNIKAIDSAGNIFSGDAESFNFKYDSITPSNVSYISPAGGNFSNVIDMNFAWPTSGGSTSADENSHVLGWQYQINSTSGTWQGTVHDNALESNYIPLTDSSYTLSLAQDGSSIVSGDNIVYFRTIDHAGNVSSDATIRTGSLKYGGAAPTFGGSDVVAISPNTSTTNQYAISWPSATPSAGRSVTHYYYMINALPPSTLATLQNNSASYFDNGTSTSVAAAALPNVNKGTNHVYVVAVDDGTPSNYSPSNFISGDFDLNSTNPDNAGNLIASDSSNKLGSNWMVTLTWSVPAYQGAGNLTYLVYRSANDNDFEQVGSTSGLSYVDITPNSEEYAYKIYVKDGANATSSGTNAVTILPTGKWTSAPSLDSEPAVSLITTRKATISWSTNRGADSKVRFGTKSGVYAQVEPSNSNQVTAHTLQLSGIIPNTTYYYQAKWTDEDGNTGTSEEKSFTTAPAPLAKNVSVGSIGLSNALVRLTVKNASKVKVYYGTTTAFGGFQETATSTEETTYSIQLSGLADGTKYYYKINTFDSEGGEYDGTILNFTTLPKPEITNVRVQQVLNTAQTTLYITWESNTEISSIVSYYPIKSPSKVQYSVNIELVKNEHKMLLKGLSPQAQYAVQVKGKDKIGNEAKSDIQTVTTATDTRPPKITDLTVEGVNIPPVGSTAQQQIAQLVVAWNTDEPSTSQVEFGEGTGTDYPQKTQLDSNLTTNHLVVISGLSPSKVYHLRVLSSDSAQNQSASVDTVTITPKESDNALDLVILNLQEAFGFLKQ